MKNLRRASVTIVVALFSAGLLTVSAPAANADTGVSAAKWSAPATTSFRRDTGWN